MPTAIRKKMMAAVEMVITAPSFPLMREGNHDSSVSQKFRCGSTSIALSALNG